MAHYLARAAASMAFVASSLAAQEPYKQPPPPIAKILDAVPAPAVSVDPTRTWALLLERSALPPISQVAAPMLRLAGDRINPRNNAPARDVEYSGILLRSTSGAPDRRVLTLPGSRVANVMWSPDGGTLAFTVTNDTSVTLWASTVASGRTRRLHAAKLNAVAGPPCDWLGNSRLICKLAARMGAAPKPAAVPTGPVVDETEGRPAPNPTYEDLLRNADDEAAFEYYYSSLLGIIDLEGRLRVISQQPAMYASIAGSPIGHYILVENMRRPFSYHVPRGRFPSRISVWDTNGTRLRSIATRPLQEELGRVVDAAPAGPRDVRWRPDVPATLVWVEALDTVDATRPPPKRDRVVSLDAPFTGDPRLLAQTDMRVTSLQWARPSMAFVTEGLRKTRRTRTWMIDPTDLDRASVLLADRSTDDRYNDPGRFVTTTMSTTGTVGGAADANRVVLTSPDGRFAYRAGLGASAEGDRPFLDRVDLRTNATQRLFRSTAPMYEEVLTVLDPDGRRALTRRESVAEPPNYFARELGGGNLAQLTTFKDPAPQFAGVTQQLITYRRADSVQLSATLYLPAGYDKTKGPLPFFLWAYPREFLDAASASQVQGSPFRFTRPSGASHLFLLLQGYGVLDGPAMPIIGRNGNPPNDSYIPQLVASAQAAVNTIVAMGVADRDRIGVGGHSYGAFMTANLLAHTNLFKAGIARSGAYNRTLTPFGFQAEERDFWQASAVYEKMSPFWYADSIQVPLLLIHGMDDDNTGTFPIQSERFFAALKGKGVKARLVMLPAEAHGYRARESIGHTLWEMVNWMDLYVKPVLARKPNA